MDINSFSWLNEPERYEINSDRIVIYTEPVTDFWQRTYYNFRHDNAHALLFPVAEKEFSFFVKTEYKPERLFDQCGIVLYQDSDNWAKASCEYENGNLSNLGSVVTGLGYSDWSARPVSNTGSAIWYRLSRRGQDFEIRTSFDGVNYDFMRIFHMHKEADTVNIGIYACSPLISTVKCTFSELELTDCKWELYVNPDEEQA